MSKAKFFILIFGLFIILTIVAFFLLGIWLNAPPSPAQDSWIGQEFEIQNGDTWSELARRLKSEQLIKSQLWFHFLVYLAKDSATLKAGTYVWPRFLTSKEIINFFQVAQPQKTFPITIPEGLTRREIGLLLEKKRVLVAADFYAETADILKYADSYDLPIPSNYQKNPAVFSLEGFLFPDTYFLPASYSAEKMVALMLRNFVAQLDGILPSWRTLSSDELYSKIVLASVVQKEYRAKVEAPIIASVFENRLQQGIKLESCATVVYVLTEERGRAHPNRILFRDLEEESPYNTYLNEGLIPSPIANVGTIALQAVFFPAQTDYLFFVVKDAAKGTHVFSSSLTDHNAARKTYLDNYFR